MSQSECHNLRERRSAAPRKKCFPLKIPQEISIKPYLKNFTGNATNRQTTHRHRHIHPHTDKYTLTERHTKTPHTNTHTQIFKLCEGYTYTHICPQPVRHSHTQTHINRNTPTHTEAHMLFDTELHDPRPPLFEKS